MAKRQVIQADFLNRLRRENIPVALYLANGIKLQGQIDWFDQYVILLKGVTLQMVFKHAISTIVPAYMPEAPAQTPSYHDQESPYA